ncbi:Uncharacterised protein [uncultured archaeon]|nr:Uncharacterised protein [uncultured archaeon]
MSNNASNLDIDIKVRLVYAKRLFTIGIEHEYLDSEMDRLVAVLHYDASIEHLLNTILAFFEFPIKKEKNETFSYIFDAVNTALEENKDKIGIKFFLPNRREIEQLHVVRNQAQHYGIIPDIKFVQRYRETTENFMKDVIHNIFKLNYSDITLAILIQNEQVRKTIEEAEKSFFNMEYEKSMKLSSMAFAVAKSDEQQRIFGSGSLYFKFRGKSLPIAIKPTLKGHELAEILELLIDFTSEFSELVLEELEILKLRLDYKKYMHYKKISPQAEFSDGGDKEPKIIETVKKNYNHNNALFCLNFVIDSILKWESFKSPRLFDDFSNLLSLL